MLHQIHDAQDISNLDQSTNISGSSVYETIVAYTLQQQREIYYSSLTLVLSITYSNCRDHIPTHTILLLNTLYTDIKLLGFPPFWKRMALINPKDDLHLYYKPSHHILSDHSPDCEFYNKGSNSATISNMEIVRICVGTIVLVKPHIYIDPGFYICSNKWNINKNNNCQTTGRLPAKAKANRNVFYFKTEDIGEISEGYAAQLIKTSMG